MITLQEAADRLRATATRHGRSREDLIGALTKTLCMEDNPRGLTPFERAVFKVEEELIPEVPNFGHLDDVLMRLSALIHDPSAA